MSRALSLRANKSCECIIGKANPRLHLPRTALRVPPGPTSPLPCCHFHCKIQRGQPAPALPPLSRESVGLLVQWEEQRCCLPQRGVIQCMGMHPAWAAPLPASHSHPIPLSLMGETEARRDPSRAEQLPNTLQHCPFPTGQNPPLGPLSGVSQRCRARRAEPCPPALSCCRQASAVPASLLCLPTGFCLRSAKRGCHAHTRLAAPGPARPAACMHARVQKKPPVISFPSAVPSSSSGEPPPSPTEHKRSNANSLPRVLAAAHPCPLPAAEGRGAGAFPGGFDSFPAQLRNSRLVWQPRGWQRRRGHGQAGPGWTGARKAPGTQGWDTRRDGKEPASQAGWAP